MGDQERRATIVGDELIGASFSDVTLMGILFTETGVNLELEMPDTRVLASTSARLVCRWLHAVEITLDLTKHPHAPLTWDGLVARSAAGALRVSFSFPGAGTVSVESDEMLLESRT